MNIRIVSLFIILLSYQVTAIAQNKKFIPGKPIQLKQVYVSPYNWESALTNTSKFSAFPSIYDNILTKCITDFGKETGTRIFESTKLENWPSIIQESSNDRVTQKTLANYKLYFVCDFEIYGETCELLYAPKDINSFMPEDFKLEKDAFFFFKKYNKLTTETAMLDVYREDIQDLENQTNNSTIAQNGVFIPGKPVPLKQVYVAPKNWELALTDVYSFGSFSDDLLTIRQKFIQYFGLETGIRVFDATNKKNWNYVLKSSLNSNRETLAKYKLYFVFDFVINGESYDLLFGPKDINAFMPDGYKFEKDAFFIFKKINKQTSNTAMLDIFREDLDNSKIVIDNRIFSFDYFFDLTHFTDIFRDFEENFQGTSKVADGTNKNGDSLYTTSYRLDGLNNKIVKKATSNIKHFEATSTKNLTLQNAKKLYKNMLSKITNDDFNARFSVDSTSKNGTILNHTSHFVAHNTYPGIMETSLSEVPGYGNNNTQNRDYTFTIRIADLLAEESEIWESKYNELATSLTNNGYKIICNNSGYKTHITDCFTVKEPSQIKALLLSKVPITNISVDQKNNPLLFKFELPKNSSSKTVGDFLITDFGQEIFPGTYDLHYYSDNGKVPRKMMILGVKKSSEAEHKFAEYLKIKDVEEARLQKIESERKNQIAAEKDKLEAEKALLASEEAKKNAEWLRKQNENSAMRLYEINELAGVEKYEMESLNKITHYKSERIENYISAWESMPVQMNTKFVITAVSKNPNFQVEIFLPSEDPKIFRPKKDQDIYAVAKIFETGVGTPRLRILRPDGMSHLVLIFIKYIKIEDTPAPNDHDDLEDDEK